MPLIPNASNMTLVHPKLSYKITGLCFKAHRELGRFCRERQYADRLEELLKGAGLSYQREFEIKRLRSEAPDGNRVDFLIDNKILLDLKAKNFITKEDYFQMQRYLEAANLELGLIINFRKIYLSPKRILNSHYHMNHSGHSDHSDEFGY